MYRKEGTRTLGWSSSELSNEKLFWYRTPPKTEAYLECYQNLQQSMLIKIHELVFEKL